MKGRKKRKPNCCSFCDKPGHNKQKCPDRPPLPGGEVPRQTGSASEKAARHLKQHGGTMHAAAVIFGISHQAVSLAWARLYGDEPTPAEIQEAYTRAWVVSLAWQGETCQEIMAETGVSYRAVWEMCERAGVQCVGASDLHAEAVERAVAAVQAGRCIVDAAIDSDISRKTLQRYLRASGVTARRTGLGDRKDGRSRRALELMESGVPQAEAARRARVSVSSVKAVRRFDERRANTTQSPLDGTPTAGRSWDERSDRYIEDAEPPGRAR